MGSMTKNAVFPTSLEAAIREGRSLSKSRRGTGGNVKSTQTPGHQGQNTAMAGILSSRTRRGGIFERAGRLARLRLSLRTSLCIPHYSGHVGRALCDWKRCGCTRFFIPANTSISGRLLAMSCRWYAPYPARLGARFCQRSRSRSTSYSRSLPASRALAR